MYCTESLTNNHQQHAATGNPASTSDGVPGLAPEQVTAARVGLLSIQRNASAEETSHKAAPSVEDWQRLARDNSARHSRQHFLLTVSGILRHSLFSLQIMQTLK